MEQHQESPTPHLTLPSSCLESLLCFPPSRTNRRAATQGVTSTGSSPQAPTLESTTASQPLLLKTPQPLGPRTPRCQRPTQHPAPPNTAPPSPEHQRSPLWRGSGFSFIELPPPGMEQGPPRPLPPGISTAGPRSASRAVSSVQQQSQEQSGDHSERRSRSKEVGAPREGLCTERE